MEVSSLLMLLFIYLFLYMRVCESWVPRYWFQSLLPEKCNRERVWDCENTGEKKEKETVQCPF